MEWQNVPSNIKDYLGFIYKITNTKTGRFYIGKKQFWKSTSKPPTEYKKRVVKESDWKDYYGSSNELQDDLATYGKCAFKREILSCYKRKWDLAYNELLTQLLHDVMNPNVNTYNGIINVRLRKRKTR